jgi:predicted dithiol-disulfide oxidoreductase (DUF899 family)
MAIGTAFTPATELARKSTVHFSNESEDYRRARDELLVEEIELRRHIERVAAQRRQLPPSGKVTGEYRFEAGTRDRDAGRPIWRQADADRL